MGLNVRFTFEVKTTKMYIGCKAACQPLSVYPSGDIQRYNFIQRVTNTPNNFWIIGVIEVYDS